MTTYSRTAILAIVAFGVGGVGGFLLAKKLLEQHYQELAQIDVDDVKEYYRKKYEGKKAINSEEDDEKIYRKIVTNYVKPDLHTLATKNIEEDENDEFYVDPDGESEIPELDEEEIELAGIETTENLDPTKEPYLITYDEYVAPTDIFGKMELFYYRFDDIICTADDVVVPEPEDQLGWEWMKALETKTTTFVRNEKLAIDFEIHSFSKSYGEEVAARIETDKEKKYRRLARKKEAMDSAEEYEDEDRPVSKKKESRRPKKPIVSEEIE